MSLSPERYTGADGHRYRWRWEPGVVGVAVGVCIPLVGPELLHESFDGIDQDRNETWVDSLVVDEAAAAEALARLKERLGRLRETT